MAEPQCDCQNENCKCGYKEAWKARHNIYGCERKVSSKIFNGKKIGKFEKLTALPKYQSAINEFTELITKFSAGQEWNNIELTDLLGWKSLGDLARKLNDYFVCRGLVEKTQFNVGKKGHRYIRVNIGNCPFFDERERKCINKTFIFLGNKRDV